MEMKRKKPSKHDKIRMILLSTGQSEVRHFEFNLKRLIVILFFATVVTAGLFMASATISNSVHEDTRETDLQHSNAYLKQQIVNLQDEIYSLSQKLYSLEANTEDLEVLVGLTTMKLDGEDITSSADEASLVMSALPVDFEYQKEKMTDYLTSLESRIQQAHEVQSMIEDTFLRTSNQIEAIPSIRPVTTGRITDRFGIRKDPFVARRKHHKGIDLEAAYGTEVYAAGAGVVEFSQTRYRLNTGYGRVVIINHGHGYKTLYGHLSKVFVKRGQRVNRWDLIGLAGNTGRATGPHLHYEVWKDRKAQDPEQYILN